MQMSNVREKSPNRKFGMDKEEVEEENNKLKCFNSLKNNVFSFLVFLATKRAKSFIPFY